MTADRFRLDVDEGKYTLVVPFDGRAFALRYGQPWLSADEMLGSNMILSMAYELEELRDKIARLQAEVERLRARDWQPIATAKDEADKVDLWYEPRPGPWSEELKGYRRADADARYRGFATHWRPIVGPGATP